MFSDAEPPRVSTTLGDGIWRARVGGSARQFGKRFRSYSSAVPRQGEAGHSLLPERWALTRRHVRSEAGPEKIRRSTAARNAHDRTQNRRCIPVTLSLQKKRP